MAKFRTVLTVVLPVAALASVIALSAGALAQMGPGAPTGGYTPPPSQTQNDNMRELDKLRSGSKNAPTREDILRDAGTLAKSAGLSCQVSDAALLNDGTAEIGGQKVHVRTFELACTSGMGYFVAEQGDMKPVGFSCFAADAMNKADKAARSQTVQPTCSLPANSDLKAAAAKVVSGFGHTCEVTNWRVIGQQSSTATEFDEVACTGNVGYAISSPLPGSIRPLSVATCIDAYQKGVQCKLSPNGAPSITMQTFKDELAKHNVACNSEKARLVGKENKAQRHVVEFKCPAEHPEGLVALIPLEGNTAPFETISCDQAAARYKIICTLNN